MTTEHEQDIHERRIALAQEVIHDLIMTRHLSMRDALIEVAGTEEAAENLAGAEHGIYSNALENAVWEKVKKEIPE